MNNEERLQQYVVLIQEVLSCPDGEEWNILNDKMELVDFGLVQALLQESSFYLKCKLVANSERLTNLAQQITNSLQQDPNRAVDDNILLNFLVQILQEIRENLDPKIIYPILAKHQDKLTLDLAAIIQQWTLAEFAGIEDVDQAYRIYADIVNLAWLISQFPLGNRAINLEIVITANQTMLSFFTRSPYPVTWAMTQRNLGSAYYARLKGNRAENIEIAIQCYQLALEVYTREDFQEDWVGIQNNLAYAYYTRLKGNRAENIEIAIQCYHLALEVYTREDFRENWAMTQRNLGVAYYVRIRGDQAENIEEAIKCYQLTLEVYTSEDFREDWAMTQNNLGLAYIERKKGNRAENIEMAISSYRLALEVCTREDFREHWARIQNNLANAYYGRIRGDQAENIEEAIKCYQLTLKVYTREDFQENWAITQNNLAIAYSDRLKGDRAENIEEAIARYHLALEVYTREDFREKWAMTQNNLATAYYERLKGDRAENIEEAIARYHLALEVRTSEVFPNDCLQTGRNLGNLGFREGMWQIAITGYVQAIEAAETSRSWAKDEARREEIHAESIEIYSNIVQAYINLKQYDKAMEYVERSRSRRLVELMHSKDLYGDAEIPAEVKALLTAYEAKQQEIDRILRLLLGDGRSLTAARELRDSRDQRALNEAITAEIKILEQEKQEIWLELRRRDPVLASQQKVDALDFKAMQALISDQPHTAILNIYSTDTNVHILILRSTGEPTYFHCADLNGIGIADLNQWIKQSWLDPYLSKHKADKQKWSANMPQFLRQLAQTLHIDRLITKHLQNIEELIIIPHRALHQIPFAALPIDPPQPPLSKGGEDKVPLIKGDLGGSYLSDRFKIRYIPSTQILKFCSDRGDVPFAEQIPQFSTVEDTREDLMFAAFEGSQIAKMFAIEQARRLQGKQSATKTAYRQALKHSRALLSSHHAEARLDIPLESMLLLGDGAITLGELLTSRYPDIVDVFLSCCETGLGISQNLTDDIVTLGTGFLCAGARSVISSLWKVDDLATAIFSIFYHEERQKGCDRLTALQNAQTQLREMTRMDLHEIAIDWDLKAYLGKLLTPLYAVYDNIKNDPEKKEQKKEIDKLLSKLSNALALIAEPKEEKAHLQPFASPDFWAAFTIQGLG